MIAIAIGTQMIQPHGESVNTRTVESELVSSATT